MRYGDRSGAVPLRRDRISMVKEGAFGVFCIVFGLAVLLIHHHFSTQQREYTLDELAPPSYVEPSPDNARPTEPIVINNTWINTRTDDPETIRYFESMESHYRGMTGHDLNQGEVELLPRVQGASMVFEFAPRAGPFTPEVTLEFYEKVVRPGNLWSAERFNSGLERMQFYNQAGERTDYAEYQRNAGLEAGDGQYRHIWQRE